MTDDPAIGTIVEILRSYIRMHPCAVDTPRGIREWWLAELPRPPDPALVDAAIARLAAEGLLEPVQLPDRVTAWRAVPSGD